MNKQKLLRKALLSAGIFALCVAFSPAAAALSPGDVVDTVLSTDIRAYIDGYEIPAYNVGGRLGVVAEDLYGYGFDVVWDAGARTLSVTKADRGVTDPVAVADLSDLPVGTPVLPVLYTDIVTDLDGAVVESFNIDGKTIVYFSALSAYGSRLYDNDARISMLSTRGSAFPTVTLEDLPEKIVHAGGLADEIAGTNSLEALNATYAAGFRYIEMDFLLSSDGEPVALHDWSPYYSPVFPDGEPVTAAEFRATKIFGLFTPMTFSDLYEWLKTHTDVYIITDVKDENVAVLRQIAARYPDVLDRMIPQIYQFDEYAPVRALGYGNIVLTCYRLPTYAEKANAAALAAFAKTHHLLAITADATLASAEYVAAFNEAGVPLFVHTVNGAEVQKQYYDLGVTCVYTDYAN